MLFTAALLSTDSSIDALHCLLHCLTTGIAMKQKADHCNLGRSHCQICQKSTHRSGSNTAQNMSRRHTTVDCCPVKRLSCSSWHASKHVHHLLNLAACFHCLQAVLSSDFHCRTEEICEIHCSGINNSFLVILQADSEHLDYEYRADAEYPSPEDSLIHSVINAAQVKNSSSLMMSATHLAGNTAQGAGGAIFATSSTGVYLLCGSSNLADTGLSMLQLGLLMHWV